MYVCTGSKEHDTQFLNTVERELKKTGKEIWGVREGRIYTNQQERYHDREASLLPRLHFLNDSR